MKTDTSWKIIQRLLMTLSLMSVMYSYGLAANIPIDLGASTTPTKVPTVISKKTMPLKTTNSVIQYVHEMNLSNQKWQVQLYGQNLKKPMISILPDERFLFRFPNTTLQVPFLYKPNQPTGVVKIRAAMHPPKVAWVVINAKEGTRFVNLQPVARGFILTLEKRQSVTSNNMALKISNLQKPKSVVAISKPVAPAKPHTVVEKMLSHLINISVNSTSKSMKIVLTTDSPIRYLVRTLVQPDRLLVHFPNTSLKIKKQVRHYANGSSEVKKGGLLAMQINQLGSSLSPISEVILTMIPGTIHEVNRTLNQVVITLTAPKPLISQKHVYGNIDQRVSADLNGADLSAVLKTLGTEAGFNVNIFPGVSGTVNESFKNIPLKTALGILLSPNNDGYEIQGNVLEIGPIATLKADKAALPHITRVINPGNMTATYLEGLIAAVLPPTNQVTTVADTQRNLLIVSGTPSDVYQYERIMQSLNLGAGKTNDLITRVVRLNYADPVSMATLLTPYLTPEGKVQADEQNESIIIYDTASNIPTLLDLVKELDVQLPQVLIEANIVEVSNQNNLYTGVNWNMAGSISNSSAVTGILDQPVATSEIQNPGSIAFGTLKSGFNVSAEIQELEQHQNGKIISQPRVATVSGTPAMIQEIDNVLYVEQNTTVGLGGATTSSYTVVTLPLPIQLNVTPRITTNGLITTAMAVSITTVSGQPPQVPGATAPPPTTVQTATTTLTVKNGETIVIGGLVRDTLTKTVNKIPLLGDLPIIGALFQNEDYQKEREELIIFVTPTLITDN